MLRSKPSVHVAYMRGGTSKALFFHRHDVPSPGPERDRFLIRVMGSPDPMQIDGMGGTHIVTSKVALISPSDRENVDVDYTFVQVGINESSIDYDANCGNISAGVGPFAIQEGLIKDFREGISLSDGKVRTQEVRIFNTGTKKVLVSHVAIGEDGMPLEDQGDFEIAGCPGTAAPILMDYRNVIGAALGRGPLPTGKVVDTVSVQGKEILCTICDVANIIVFANASDLGISGSETSSALTDDKALISRVKELRGKAAQKVGMCKHWEHVDEEAGMLPMVALVSSPTNQNASIQSRIFLDNKCHTSMAGTGAICTTACSRITGSIVNTSVSKDLLREQTFQIQHPAGLMPVIVETTTDQGKHDNVPGFKTLSFIRTARRIWDGNLYVPFNVRDTVTALLESTKSSVPSRRAQDAKDNRLEVTQRITNFVHDTKFSDLSEEVVEKLKELILDHIGVGAAATLDAESSAPFITAVKALCQTNSGRGTVFASGAQYSKSYAAMLNAALSHSLDFDDTHADGFLHPGVTVIASALAEAESNSAITSSELFTALAVGYEVTCRLGVALGSGGSQRGFHNTSTAGIFGAVAALSKLRKLNETTINNAFGLAVSKAAGSMQYLANGSWNKRLHPGFAAHDAFTVTALAEAGVIGAAEPIEGQNGLLNLYSSDPQPKILQSPFETSQLCFMDTSIKPYPACRLTHPQIEAAAKLREQLTCSTSEIKRVSIKMSPEAFTIVGVASPNKKHPSTIVDAQFSSFYQTAITLLYGSGQGWKAYNHLKDPAVSGLLDKITIEVDDTFGRIETTIEIEQVHGAKVTQGLKTLRGEPGNPFTWDDVVNKFVAIASPVYGADQAGRIITVVRNLDQHGVSDLMSLVA